MKTQVKPEDRPRGSFVFVVDDDGSVREALSSLIRSVGLNVATFSSAREFLRQKLPDVPSCLVLDVRLPGLSGLDLQRELTEASIHIPIIFITGHGDIPMSVRAMKDGAVEFLTKPFRDQELLDAIQQALANDRSAWAQRRELLELRTLHDSLTPREREVMGWWFRECSTSRSPPTSAPARSPSKSSAARSCARCRPPPWRTWCAWRSG